MKPITKNEELILSWQKYQFELFDYSIQNEQDCLVNINSLPFKRQIGKTTVLNDISLTYQALGYKVLVWTPFNDIHYGSKLVRYIHDAVRLGLRPYDKMICIIDESDLTNSFENHQIRNCLEKLDVKLVGFYR